MKYTSFLFIAALARIAAAQPLVEPGAGAWRTFVIPSGTAMRVAPPPDEYMTAVDLQQVEAAVATRDANETAQVIYWDSGSPGYRWMQIAAQEFANRNLAPTLATREMALVAAAIHDATIAAWDSKFAYNRPRPVDYDSSIQTLVAVAKVPGYPSEYSATAAAACAVLSYLFPDSAARFQQLSVEAGNSRLAAGVEFPSDGSAGFVIGRAVGDAVVAYAKADGSDAQFTGSFPAAPGKWSSTNPVTPLAGNWKPWVLGQTSEVRPQAPPAFDSKDMADQYAIVKNLNRTTIVSRTAWVWQASFITPWVDTISQKISEYHLDRDAPRAAQAYAFPLIAMHDATLACWDTKYTYLEMRPSMADSTIVTLFPNPQHPGYPSGHACASGAAGGALAWMFPADAQFFLDQAAQAGTSTFDAGIHTPLDVDTGLKLGATVAQRVIAVAAGTAGSQ